MFRNYLKIAFRHISRNKGYVFINVMGLGVALAISIIAFVNWQQGQTADKYHENLDNLYQVIVSCVGMDRPTADVVAPLVARAANEISGIKAGIRWGNKGVTIKSGTDVFRERLSVADDNFLETFTFPLLEGDKSALKDPSKIFISEEKAKKYFGTQTPIGKQVTINAGEAGQKELTIAGVFAKIPKNSSIRFDFLTNLDFLKQGPNPYDLTKWSISMDASFVLLDKGVKQTDITEQLNSYIPEINEANEWRTRVKYLLQPMRLAYLESREVNNNRLNGVPNNALFWLPGILALMILITACLNFTNTTISFSNKRLKEMGIRKVMGSGRQQLITQLLGESLIICVLSLFLGVVIAEYLLPTHNNMWDFLGIEVALDYFNNTGLLLFLVGIVLFTALLGGAYPAFYISAFKPSAIFRGNTRFGGDNWLIRSLLGVQVAVSLMTVVGGISFMQNANYQKSFDLGYDSKSIINVSLNGALAFNKFKNGISENPHILGVAGAKNNLGFNSWSTHLGKAEDNRDVQTHLVGEQFLEVMDLNILEGRTFDENLETDYSESVLITQKLVDEQQWTSPIGKKIETYGTTKKVIGVVEDFYPHNFFRKPIASVFHFEKPDSYRVMKVKVAPSQLISTNKFLNKKWAEIFPLMPFESYYQDETMADALMITQNGAKLYLFLALIAVFLATTGLYSLVAMNVQKRAKEIAIRRVLGAGVKNITYILNKNYFIIFAIGGVLGAVIGGQFSAFALDLAFEVYQQVDKSSVILAVIGICIIGAMTIGSKLVTVLQANPADTLKSE